MNVPGSNILGLALTVITPQPVKFYAWTGNATNSVGKDVPAYAEPVTRQGSFQPISKASQAVMGLEMGKSYATVYAPGTYRTLERDGSPDQFGYGGRRWSAQSARDWAVQDGWSAVLCVDVGADA